ncbi:MAG: hypothetical protein WB421_07495 [Terriglobales bacterium]
MTFFDEQGNAISCQQWLDKYLPYYFLNGPKWGGRPRNQTSYYVEDTVCALLTKTPPLSLQDLVLAMAWKIGLIDHGRSEFTKKIEYQQNWPTTLTARLQYGTLNFSSSIPYLATNMAAINAQLNRDPQYLFNMVRRQLPQVKGFGYVYILTLQFFITHGKFPIYDKFAHVAALAIDQGLSPASPPKSYVKYGLTKWSDYDNYMNLLARIRNAYQQQAGSPMFISRDLDRALWVYGHFFETNPQNIGKATPVRSQTPTPIASGSINILVGKICDLSNTTTDGWRRREINVKQSPDGYPDVRDMIHLIDSSGAKYTGLQFIKGARHPGHTCLGQAGALKSWFRQHYSADRVETQNVYFKSTGHPNEYRIYTESEWKALAKIEG